MEYIYFSYVNDVKQGEEKTLVNYGDYFQCFAVKQFLKKLGINEEAICDYPIEISALNSDKTKKILPLQWNVIDNAWMKKNNITFANHMQVVFLGAILNPSSVQNHLNEHNLQVLKSLQPFGCRDMYTLTVLRQHGIQAYFTGCITAVLERRNKVLGETADKVMFIDAPLSLKPYVPKDLLENAVFYSQQEYVNSSASQEDIKRKIEDRYDEYTNHAKLIVTSRMHVAMPALAKGIPVIFAKEVLDNRLSVFKPFFPLYSEHDFANIDWHPKPVQYEAFKKKLQNAYVELLEKNPKNCRNLKYVSEVYENAYNSFELPKHYLHVLHRSYEKAAQHLALKYTEGEYFEYHIWGLSDAAEGFYQWMCKTYPKATLKFAIDSYKSGYFQTISIKKPNEVDFTALQNVMVLPVGACGVATQYFKERNILETQYCLCAELYLTQ